uniref:Uncharacterized protein n=1 Tax=Megaselia scalaris TaxID=36166 RepID=T1GQJ3_MEGSC
MTVHKICFTSTPKTKKNKETTYEMAQIKSCSPIPKDLYQFSNQILYAATCHQEPTYDRSLTRSCTSSKKTVKNLNLPMTVIKRYLVLLPQRSSSQNQSKT